MSDDLPQDPFDKPLGATQPPSWFWSACELWTALEAMEPVEVRRALAGLDEDTLRQMVYVELAVRSLGFGD
jgi:hypothetical protein